MTANKLEGKAQPHYSAIIKALARIVNVRQTDEQVKAEVIPRDPVMAEVVAIRDASDQLIAIVRALNTARQHEIRDQEHQHSCSYYCDRPECVKAQRDELREKYVARQSEGMVCIGWEFNDPRDELGWQRLHGVGPASSPPYADPVQVRRIFAAAPADGGA